MENTEDLLMQLGLAIETMRRLAEFAETGDSEIAPDDWAIAGAVQAIGKVMRALEESLPKTAPRNPLLHLE
jgi:hypothetical protein